MSSRPGALRQRATVRSVLAVNMCPAYGPAAKADPASNSTAVTVPPCPDTVWTHAGARSAWKTSQICGRAGERAGERAGWAAGDGFSRMVQQGRIIATHLDGSVG